MGKASIVATNNLSAGELSPAMHSRTELAQYRNGAREMLNMIPLVEGGAKRRDGTRHRGVLPMPTGFDDDNARMIPFVVRAERSFVLVFKPGSILIWDANNGPYNYQIDSPYEAEDIANLKFAQNRYSMWIVCGTKPVHWLRCSSDFTTWSIEPFAFDVPPLDEVVDTPDVGLKPSGSDYGAVIDLTAASYPQWLGGKPYFVGDKVFNRSIAWRCIQDHTNQEPITTPSVFWEVTPDAAAGIFEPSIVGSIIFINGGVVRVSQYIVPQVIRGEVIKKLTSDVLAIAKSWTLKSTAFTAALGYPKTVTYFKQRLVFAATETYPNMIWFSRVGDSRNFLSTSDDADSIYVATFSDQKDEIYHLTQSRGVVALTGGSEFSIDSDGTLTPTSVKIIEHTFYGAQSRVRPCRVGNELLFVPRGGTRMRAMAYRYEVDSLVSPEISTLSKHLAEQHGGIIEITYQQEPNSIVWCVLQDGKVASLTLNREQEVVAWALHDFGGRVLSMCSVATRSSYDPVWLLVMRRNQWTGLDELVMEDMVKGVRVDCCTNKDFFSEPGSFVVPSAKYTPALTAYKGNQIVSLKPYSDTDIRMDYDGEGDYFFGINFTSRLDLFPPELAQPPQTTRTSKAKCNRISFALLNTPTFNYNGRKLEFRKFSDELLAPIEEGEGFTGLYSEDVGDFVDMNDFKTTIELSDPLPMYVQAVLFDITVNEYR